MQAGLWLYFIALAGAWAWVVFHSPWNPDYTAGELYDAFLAWQEKGRLYFPLGEEPFRVLNYPPLFFYLTKGLAFLLPFDPLQAGRMVSLASAILGFVGLYAWLRRRGLSDAHSLSLVAFSATSFPLLYPIPQFHLQWTAVALSLWGLFFLERRTSLSTLGAALLLILACFAKQTQVISWGIGLVWIFFQNRRQAALFIAASFAAGALLARYCQWQFGAELWVQIFTYTVGTFSLSQLAREIGMHVGPWAGFFALALWKLRKSGLEKRQIAGFYFLGQSLWLLSSAREGASYQYFMEWSLALLLWLGPWLVESLPRPARLLLDLQYFAGAAGVGLLLFFHAGQIRALQKDLPEICSALAGSRSYVLADDPGLVRACGKVPALQPFIFNNLAKKRLWEGKRLAERIQGKSYDFILLPFDPRSTSETERWAPEAIQAIRENYSEIKRWDRAILLRPQP